MRMTLVIGLLAASLIAGCSASSPAAVAPSAASTIATATAPVPTVQPTVAPTRSPTAPPTPSPSQTPIPIPILAPAAVCAVANIDNCLEGIQYVIAQSPGKLVAVCEYESGSGAVLELDRPEDASNCSSNGGRVVAVGRLPSP